MKVLNLQCAHQHEFEGWFGSEDDFVNQLGRGLVTCPLCGDAHIQKKLSAPRLNLRSGRHDTDAPPASVPMSNHTQSPELAALQARGQLFGAGAIEEPGGLTAAGADRILQRSKRVIVSARRNLRVEWTETGGAVRSFGQPVRHGACREHLGLVEQAEPDQRSDSPGPRIGQRRQLRLKRQACLVGNVAGQGTASLPRRVGGSQHGGHVACAPRDEHLPRIFEQVRVRRAVGTRVVEQYEWSARGHPPCLSVFAFPVEAA